MGAIYDKHGGTPRFAVRIRRLVGSAGWPGYNVNDAAARLPLRPEWSAGMAMDFETIKYFRILFAIIGACVGGAAGISYFGLTGGFVGLAIGAVVGWNAVDLIKGRAHK